MAVAFKVNRSVVNVVAVCEKGKIWSVSTGGFQIIVDFVDVFFETFFFPNEDLRNPDLALREFPL